MIIDALTHILPPYFNEHRDEALARDRTFAELFADPKARIAQAEHLLEEMDRSEVERSVVAGFGWTDLDLAKRSNDYLLESATRHPDILIPLCSVNPLWPGDDAPKEAERCLNFGARGIGELHADTQGWGDPPYDRLDDVLFVAREYVDSRNKIAFVVVHGSEPLGHTYPGKGAMTP
ncbi:MAG: amidohydrolase family protein, partial [Chloroflexi bacterium]|nr:amidohydrolase family protein [Chloroflexota bacterium]